MFPGAGRRRFGYHRLHTEFSFSRQLWTTIFPNLFFGTPLCLFINTKFGTASPTWGDLSLLMFSKALSKLCQSSKLKARPSLFTEPWQKRRSCFELWVLKQQSNMWAECLLGCLCVCYVDEAYGTRDASCGMRHEWCVMCHESCTITHASTRPNQSFMFPYWCVYFTKVFFLSFSTKI